MELWVNLFKKTDFIAGEICQECNDGDNLKSELT